MSGDVLPEDLDLAADYLLALALLTQKLRDGGGRFCLFDIDGVPTARWLHNVQATEVSGTSFGAAMVGLCVELGIWDR